MRTDSQWKKLSAVVLVALALLAAAPACADPPNLTIWGLPQLMAGMREVPGATATFSERKFDRLLKQPLQSSGRLIFVAPDQLQKETLAPASSRLTVKGDWLTVVQPDGELPSYRAASFQSNCRRPLRASTT